MKGRATGIGILVGLLLPCAVVAQYSNSWVNFTQQYYKVPVAAEGIYRLTYSNLQAAGFPVNTVDPRFIQLMHRGKEQTIYVKGQADAVFNPSDYIEFYGGKNDGTLDSSLYQPASLQPHKFYNLYSDTTAYFLTYSFAPPRGMRMDSLQLVNVGNLLAENFQYAQRLLVVHDDYSGGLTASDYTQSTYFDQGEGWTGYPLQQGVSIDYVIDSVLNGVTSAGVPKLELLLVGRDAISHSLQVFVGANGGSLRLLASPNFFGFQTNLLTADLTWADVGANGKITVRIVAQSASTNRYQASASYLKVTFPQNFDLSGLKKKEMKLALNAGGQSYVVINNPPSGLKLWDISDLRNIVRIGATPSGGTLTAIVPGTSVSKKLWADASYRIPSIIPVAFRPLNSSSANFIIITNKILMKPALGYPDPVKAYAGYRASAAGGSYDSLVVPVDQLYDQFNYGEVSPLAIYNFMKMMATQGTINYLFLVGKGRTVNYSAYQRKPLLANELHDLVPSAGYPGGDAAYTAGLNGTTYEPAVPTGRLTASTAAQVAAYLNKVKELEAQPLQPWAKEILHLSGGGSAVTDAFELASFRQVVDGFKQIAEGPYLGGHVTTKAKQNVGVEKISVSDNVNAGVNLVTFFGHSSSNTIDIDIGNVSDPTLGYINPGKYPVFLVNGCNAGTIFENGITFSEDWMLAAGKGSRNFIANTSFGFSGDLQQYSSLFYQVGFADSVFIKKGIGDIQKEVGKRYLNNAPLNIYSIAQVQQMVLAGDPAIKLFGTSKPDYSVTNGSLTLASLDGKPVTSLSNFIAVKIIVKNLGAYRLAPLRIRVVRTFNDNSSKTYDSIFAPILFTDTLVFKLRKESVNGFGNNLFTVVIDPLNAIKEISKANNTATLSAFIPSNGTFNLYPPPFGIVNAASANLLFQDADLLGAKRDFLVQLDTVDTFNSTFAIRQTVSGKVLAKATVNLLLNDSIVYYWRTKPVKKNASDSANWTVSSFIHILNSPKGWAQTKFAQVATDAQTGLSADFAQKKLKYLQTVSQISVKSIGTNSSSPFTDASIKIDGKEYNVSPQVPCRTNTINLVAFNKTTATPYPGISFYFNDQRGCGLQPSVINSFLSSEVETGNGDDLLQYVDNIQASDSVVLYTVGNPVFSSWSINLLNKLNALGISNSQITSLQDGEPVIIFTRKGAAIGSAKIIKSATAPVTSQDVAVAATITGRYSNGNVKSSLIGPASKWIRFTPQSKNVEAVDQVSFSVYGVSLSGQETLLQANITGNFDLSSVDPVVYPQLHVAFYTQDAVNLTAAQIKNWFVLYEPVAEGILFYQGAPQPQTVQEGQPFVAQYAFANISTKSFSDSLQAKAEIITRGKASSEINIFKIKAPAPGDTTNFSVTINTQSKAGLNDVNLFVNPKILPEQYYENNVIDQAQYLNVLTDKSAPSLDVTVDGRYLQNGDFVSPSPVIRIKLHDENKFLLVTDTTHLNIFLSYPCDTTHCPFVRMNFSRSDVQWQPAASGSDFVATFSPKNLPEGTYTLQVTGTDANNNRSGAQPYEVTFQIKNETTLALHSVYPNPSNGIFNFSFTLSGNLLPDDFMLQIFSIDGQLAQQFGLNDIHHFIIGTNELPWSATQANLSNGIFVYRLTVRAKGKTVSQSGKLVLMK